MSRRSVEADRADSSSSAARRPATTGCASLAGTACYSPNHPDIRAIDGVANDNTVGGSTDVSTDPISTSGPIEPSVSSGGSSGRTSDVGESTDPEAAVCGNAIPEQGEACDDGDAVDGNGCNIDCAESGTVLWELVWQGDYFYDVDVTAGDGVLAVGGGSDGASGDWFFARVTADGYDEGGRVAVDRPIFAAADIGGGSLIASARPERSAWRLRGA